MLAQGVANEQKKFTEVSVPKKVLDTKTTEILESKEIENAADTKNIKPISTEKNTENTTSVKTKQNGKYKGGRPKNKEKGIATRKQYTLTLKEDTYKTILEKANNEGLSFAKFMERAALEYIDNHGC